MRIAVIGAGPAGLAAARRLRAGGVTATVFDKGRGPGGRTVSRRTPHGPLDLGAQYFTARGPRFQAAVSDWRAAGAVAPWVVVPRVLPEGREAGGGPRYVAQPRMSALARHLAGGLEVRTGVRVAALRRERASWSLVDTGGMALGRFDRVVVTAPAAQAGTLLAPVSDGLARTAAEVRMAPCWAVGVVLREPLSELPDAAFVSGGVLGWIARSASRPGRKHARECWVLHGTPEWSAEHLDAAPQDAMAALVDGLRGLVGARVEVIDSVIHRWRYARAVTPLQASGGVLEEAGLLVAGDWVADGRVEGAWLSGVAAAERLLGR